MGIYIVYSLLLYVIKSVAVNNICHFVHMHVEFSILLKYALFLRVAADTSPVTLGVCGT